MGGRKNPLIAKNRTEDGHFFLGGTFPNQIRSDFVKTKRLKEKFAKEPRANFTEFEMFRPLQEAIL